MPKRNYGHEKRQKELNKQRKQEEKRQRKLDRRATLSEEARENPDDVIAERAVTERKQSTS